MDRIVWSRRRAASVGLMCVSIGVVGALTWSLFGRCGGRPERAASGSTAVLLPLRLIRAMVNPSPAWQGSKRKRTFYFAVRPLIWKVRLDGRSISKLPGTPFSCAVGPGRHVLEFHHPAVRPHRVVIGPRTSGGTIRHELRFRPASLLVEVAPPRRGGAVKGVFYRFKAPAVWAKAPPRPAGLPISIPFAHGASVQATIMVYAVGYRHEERRVELVPGRRTRLAVRLTKLR